MKNFNWAVDRRPLKLQRPDEMPQRPDKFTHELKSWTMFFSGIISGDRTSDIRCTLDRRFAVGDTLLLREFDPVVQKYTGRYACADITYIQQQKSNPCAISEYALHPDYAVLSIRVREHG